jgi:cardiolipin synthase
MINQANNNMSRDFSIKTNFKTNSESNRSDHHTSTTDYVTRLFSEGDELYDAMIEAIENAEQSIYLETYTFLFDEVGQRFVEAVNAASDRQVDVYIILDAAGSMQWRTFSLLRKKFNKSVKFKWFHRWSWRNPLRFNIRNHKKVLTIDGKQAFVGGYNIHHKSSRRCVGEERWLDFHVSCQGKLAQAIEQQSKKFWLGKHRSTREAEVGDTLVITNVNHKCRVKLRKHIRQLIQQAKQSIVLITPYFVPDGYTIRTLIAAAKRGVDIQLFIPKRSDSQFIDWVARGYFSKLLEAGINIHEFQPRMLHAKVMVVDGQQAMIGSANMDFRSLFINYELILLFKNKSILQQLLDLINSIREQSEIIRIKQWRYRTWRYLPLVLVGNYLKRFL